jgi:hypothetical protein
MIQNNNAVYRITELDCKGEQEASAYLTSSSERAAQATLDGHIVERAWVTDFERVQLTIQPLSKD